MKRTLFIIALLVGFVYTADAVLKEKDLEQTLTILQAELEQYNNELIHRSTMRKERTKQLITQLLLTMKQADQNALMLYSQHQENVFDMTYACHEATKLYRDFHKKQIPFTEFLEKNSRELARYDSLITRLEALPEIMTTKYGTSKRDSCLALAPSLPSLSSLSSLLLNKSSPCARGRRGLISDYYGAPWWQTRHVGDAIAQGVVGRPSRRGQGRGARGREAVKRVSSRR